MKFVLFFIVMTIIKIVGLLIGWTYFVAPVFSLPMLTAGNIFALIVGYILFSLKVDLKL